MSLYQQNVELAESYNFPVFDPIKDLENESAYNCMILAKTGSGKSVFVRDILYQQRGSYDQAFVFCTTADLQPDLYNFIESDNVFLEYSDDILAEIYNKQKDTIISLKKAGVAKKDLPKILFIFDDILADPAIRRSKILIELFTSGRHAFITSFWLLQSLIGISPTMRKNCKVAVGYFLESEDDRKAFVMSYLSAKNSKVGMLIFDKITKEKYNAVVILNFIVEKQNPQSYVRTYKAEMITKKFKVAKKEMRNIPVPILPQEPITDKQWNIKIIKKYLD